MSLREIRNPYAMSEKISPKIQIFCLAVSLKLFSQSSPQKKHEI